MKKDDVEKIIVAAFCVSMLFAAFIIVIVGLIIIY